MEEVNLLSLAVNYPKATSFSPCTIQYNEHYLLIYRHKINIHFLIFSSFCHFLSSPCFSSPVGSLHHSGARSLCICRTHSSAGWWEWITGGHLHSGARPPCCRGFLGDWAIWAKWDTKSGWAQWHQHHLCALHVATTELRTGENTHLCGTPSSTANRVSHTLHTKCSV